MSEMKPMDHLAEARIWARYAEAHANSPDAQSIPSQLAGILHALVSIAESLAAPTPHQDAQLATTARDEGDADE